MFNWFRRSSKRRKESPEEKPVKEAKRGKPKKEKNNKDATVGQGLIYFYVIIGSQVLFLFFLVAFIMGIGKILSTPLWIFFFATLLLIAGCIYLFRKVKNQFRKVRDAVQEMNLGAQSCEISVMGGLLTMRVEQSNAPLLEAPSVPPVLDAETVENSAPQGS
jgi:hypothetical protein